MGTKTAVVIPTRYDSSRFPREPLFLIKNKSLIFHVVNKVSKCKGIDCVVVVTDNKRIFDMIKFDYYMIKRNKQ